MGRSPRPDVAGAVHHVFSRGTRRWTIFLDDLDRQKFVAQLARVAYRYEVEVVAFCLMGNHFHLVLHCIEAHLSVALRDLKSSYAAAFNRRHGYSGPLFESRFGSKVVTDDDYLLTVIRYVHRNPLDLEPELGLASYPWSSHGLYLTPDLRPSWLVPDLALGLFEGAVDEYRLFVEQPLVSDEIQNRPGQGQSSPQTTLGATYRLDDVILTVCEATSSEPGDVQCGKHNGLNGLVLLLGRDLGGYTTDELAEPLGYASAGSARQALMRVRSRIADDPKYRELVAQVTRHLIERCQAP